MHISLQYSSWHLCNSKYRMQLSIKYMTSTIIGFELDFIIQLNWIILHHFENIIQQVVSSE